MILHQKLNVIGSVNRSFDDSFGRDGAKIGSTLRIRLPNRFTVSNGPALSLQDVTEQNTTLTVASQKHVDTVFSSAQLELNVFDFSQQVLEPAMAVLASSIENDFLNGDTALGTPGVMSSVYQTASRAGSAQTFANVLLGRKRMVDALAPADGNRMARLDTQSNLDLVDNLKGLFQSTTQIKRQYEEGVMGVGAGMEFAENTLLAPFTTGTHNTAYTVNGAGQTGASLVIQTGTGTIVPGDVFTIAGVNRVHPETKVDTGVLQQFTVTATYAGGGGTISISPPILTAAAGALQTVSASPANTAAITFLYGTGAALQTQQSIVYHKDAFAFATADLPLPEGVHFAGRKMQDGISLRIVRQYDINSDRFPARIDVLYGYRAIRPELACRLWSN